MFFPRTVLRLFCRQRMNLLHRTKELNLLIQLLQRLLQSSVQSVQHKALINQNNVLKEAAFLMLKQYIVQVQSFRFRLNRRKAFGFRLILHPDFLFCNLQPLLPFQRFQKQQQKCSGQTNHRIFLRHRGFSFCRTEATNLLQERI